MSDTQQAQAPANAPPIGGLVTYLNVDGVTKAVDLYGRAFGATVAAIMPPDDKGRTMHAHLHINGASLMLSDFFPEHGHAAVKPQGFSLVLMVDDIEAAYRKAVDAGCTGAQPPQKMFWGDTFGMVRDPFGVEWGMNQGA